MKDEGKGGPPPVPAGAIEGLGAFYLGRLVSEDAAPPFMYDARDLTTHAVALGMTGSGKTGLCLTLLEEAALDGIPALAIDPKGDIGNLLLTFPKLRPQDFRPWIDEADAARREISPDELAAQTAELWRNGLAESGQDGERIGRLRAAVDIPLFTPGATHGLPIAVLRSFDAPPEAVRTDPDALRERVATAVSGLLALAGIEADPVQSREHILLSKIIEQGWAAGRDFDLGALIRAVQQPGFERVGVLDLESFFPARSRFELATTLNNLIAAPGFEAWLEGPPLDIPSLLWTPEGKPRISIFSIAHLPDAERMFFVTLLLNELLAWTRSQPGSSSLRALLYIDEVFGYLPPVRQPPSKPPLLTLLKQARAYGLGIVLATQNPVDLDYKGLGNTGTWFLGRLQTERDKERVIEGLETEPAAAKGGLDRKRMDRLLSGLEKRTFLVGNVHAEGPELIKTRWAMSYLRGPLTRPEVRRLMQDRREDPAVLDSVRSESAQPPEPGSRSAAEAALTPDRPVVPPDLREVVLTPEVADRGDSESVWRPALLGLAGLHYARASLGVDVWQDAAVLSPIQATPPTDPWEGAEELQQIPDLERPAPAAARYGSLPASAIGAKQRRRWPGQLKAWLYRERPLQLYRIPALKLTSEPGESVAEFRVRIREEARTSRDAAVAKVRAQYRRKVDSVEGKLATARNRLDREKSQYDSQRLESAVSLGSTLLGALLGRRSVTSSRAASAARQVGRASTQRDDVQRAKQSIDELTDQLTRIEAELAGKLEQVRAEWAVDALEIEEVSLSPRKSEIGVDLVALAWVEEATREV